MSTDAVAAAEALLRAHGPAGAQQAAADRIARHEQGRETWLRIAEAVNAMVAGQP